MQSINEWIYRRKQEWNEHINMITNSRTVKIAGDYLEGKEDWPRQRAEERTGIAYIRRKRKIILKRKSAGQLNFETILLVVAAAE